MSKRILQATVELDTAERNWKRVQKEAEREKKIVPSHLRDHHIAAIRLCRGNLDQASAAEFAMNKYPPIRVYR